MSPTLVKIFIHDLEVLKTLPIKSTCTRQTVSMTNSEDMEPSEQICLLKQRRQEHTNTQRDFCRWGIPGRALGRWTWMLIADHWPCSRRGALLGWMNKIPGSVSESGETELWPSCTAPGICLQKKHLQEQLTEENFTWQGAPVWIFWCLIATEHTRSRFSLVRALPGLPSSSWLHVVR